MIIDNKFHAPGGRVEERERCRASLSLSTKLDGPEPEYRRVILWLHDSLTLDRYSCEHLLAVRMSRAEARQLGRQLLEYGSR